MLAFLGDFEHYPFIDFLAWIVFMLTILLEAIVLLNLLIAIISDTFERVHEKKVATDCIIRCRYMYDYEEILKKNRDKGQKNYLHICKYLSSEF